MTVDTTSLCAICWADLARLGAALDQEDLFVFGSLLLVAKLLLLLSGVEAILSAFLVLLAALVGNKGTPVAWLRVGNDHLGNP